MTRDEYVKWLKQLEESLPFDGLIDGDKEVDLHEMIFDLCEMLEQQTCEDAVSREAVLDLISKFIVEIHTEGGRDLNAHTNDVLRQILRNVGSDRVLPPVTPQPKMGHWIRMKAYEKWGCSECNAVFRFTFKEHNFCPNCGAKMEGEE